MKKYLKSIICCSLALCSTFSIFAAGCGEGGGNLADPNAGRQLRIKTFTDGIHDLTAPEVETEDYIVKNGKTDYVLVFPDGANEFEKIAKSEFTVLFKEATNINISSKVDTEVAEGTKFISIGKTVQQQALNVSKEEKEMLTSDGARIVTKDKNIYLYTGEQGQYYENGVIYAVYDFMKICFNFEQYFRNCLEIDKDVSELKLRNFDVKDVPDLDLRDFDVQDHQIYYDGVRNYEQAAGVHANTVYYRTYRAGQEKKYSNSIGIYSKFGDYTTGAGFHNTSEFASPTHPNVNPKWFSNQGDQLCYTTRGDEQAYNDLVDHMARKVVDSMINMYPNEKYPLANYFTITQEDNTAFCTCEWCLEDKEANGGSISGAFVKLANAVTDKLYEWMADPTQEISKDAYRRDDLKCVIFVYTTAGLTPPTYWDEESQSYKMYNEDHRPNEHVVCWVVPEFEWPYDIYDPVNDAMRQKLDAWSDVCKDRETWYWYNTYYFTADEHYQNNIGFIDSNSYQFMMSMNCHQRYNSMSAYSSDNYAWRQPTAYLMRELEWDCTQDSKVLLDNYFNAMYEEVADDMYEIFYMFINQRTLLEQDLSWIGNKNGGTANEAKYYSYSGFLKPLIEKFRAVLAKVDLIYASDKAHAELIKSRVCMEMVNPLIVTLQLHGQRAQTAPFSADVREGYKAELRNMCQKYFPEVKCGSGRIIDYIDSLN